MISVTNNLSRFHIPQRDKLALSEQNLITPSITRAYSFGLVNVGTILNNYYQDPKSAIKFFEDAISVDNMYPTAYVKLGVLNFNLEKDCKKSLENIKKGIELYPIYERFYETLKRVYLKCNVPQEEIKALESKYQSLFKKELKDFPATPSKIPLQ